MTLAKETSSSPNRFNPQMLGLAREFEGWTQTDLAERLGVSQGTISKIEEGIMQADLQFIAEISKVFRRPEVFFMQDICHSLSLEGSFRKKSALTKRLLKITDARMNIERLQMNKLVDASALDLKDPPYCDPDEYSGGPIEIARLVRKHYEVGSGPIENLVELVERAGCFVRFIDYGTLLVDGFAVLSGANVPIIFINRAFPPDRRRLTLAHEFGHVIMHRKMIRPNVEDEAFAFAGELLMPNTEIKSSLYPLNLEKLARLKLKWKVSMAAILQHAKRIGAVNERYYRYMRSELSKHGFTKEEPYESAIDLEKPKLLTRVFRHFKDDLGYTLEDMCQLLFATPEEVKSLNSPNHERFQVL